MKLRVLAVYTGVRVKPGQLLSHHDCSGVVETVYGQDSVRRDAARAYLRPQTN